jgi:SH3-like domain-containing protein
MKLNRAPAVFVLWLVVLLPSCSPEPEPVVDVATVVARNASVRQKNSSTSRTLITLNVGDKVDILERQENWYRIRHGERLQGWMEESTIVTNETKARIQEIVSASQSQQPQNTAVLREEANFRIEPGRSTAIIRRLEAGTKVEVLERVTNPRPGSTIAHDAWLKVRPSPTEVGWVIASLVDFDVPPEVSQYTEGYMYTAVKPINQVQDSLAGPINWYVVAEKISGLDPQLDYDGIRVFTWNLRMHRYETAFRVRGIRGVYPLEIGQDQGNPTFRYYELANDNSTKIPRSYVMFGVVTRALK